MERPEKQKAETQTVREELETINADSHYLSFIPESIPDYGSGVSDAAVSEDDVLYFSVKDCICVKDVPSTAGSAILSGYLPPFDATAVARLKAAGGVFVGKTVQDAFGFGTFGVNGPKPAGGEVDQNALPCNPFDSNRVCGGSSAGAAGLTQRFSRKHVALSQSTGGSIVCPASFCGVAGLCPTYGRVSRHGLIDYANSLDKIGVMAKTVKLCAEALEIISGPDAFDGTCADQNVLRGDFTAHLDETLPPLRIGVLRYKGVAPTVQQAVDAAVTKLGSSCTVVPVTLPLVEEFGVSCYYILALAEASTNLAKYCGLRYGQSGDMTDVHYNEYFSHIRSLHFNDETKRRILLGTFVRMAGYRDQFYTQAARVRAKILEEYARVFADVDVLISPTMPLVAPTFSDVGKLTPTQQYLMDILTVGPNLAGLPHLSVPCGTTSSLPVGLLITGAHFKEDLVLHVGAAVERVMNNEGRSDVRQNSANNAQKNRGVQHE